MTSVESDALASFLRSRGAVVHEALELFGAARGTDDRGVFAVEPIQQGTLLLKLPASAVIRACDDGPECEWMPAAARAASPMLRTALFLMRESALGPRSDWAAYLSSLPASYDTLEHWSQEELAALRGTSVYEELSGLRDASGSLVGPVAVMWDKVVAPIVTAAPEHWPSATLDSFLNACAAVRTRGFYDTAAGGGGPYMLPAIDMLNHARSGTATSLVVERGGDAAMEGGKVAIAGGDGDSTLHSSGAGSSSSPAGASSSSCSLVFSMEAERDICVGDEIVHVYDHLDPARLLLTYGFVPRANEGALPATARIQLSTVLEACESARAAHANGTRQLPWDPSAATERKAAACKRLLAPYDGVMCVSEAEPLPDALLTVALLSMLPAEEFDALLADGAAEAQASAASADVRVPLLDSSALDDEPALAAACVEVIVSTVTAAERRYATQTTQAMQPKADKGSPGGAVHERRLGVARALCDEELAALSATRRAALKLLVTVGLGEAAGGESEDEEDGEDEDGEEGEEEEGEEEEDDDDNCAVPVEPLAKRSRV